jgi:hypothetical protein
VNIDERFGTPMELSWDGDISRREWDVTTYNHRVALNDAALQAMSNP